MLINEKPLQYWMDHFYGYGSWDAKIWFVAYEEGGGDLPEEVAEKINYFYNTHNETDQPTLCNIRELYQHVTFEAEGPRANLFKTLHGYRFGTNAILHGVWRNLISFVHGYNREEPPDRLEYQQKIFASGTKHEALIQLYPLPSPHDHAWYYSWLDLPQFRFLRRRSTYEETIYPQRIQTILNQMQSHKPAVVVMYGMNNINGLKKSVQDAYPSAKFKMVKGTKLEIPQHHITHLDSGTTLVITTQMPALKHNRAETGFDWEAFGRSIGINSNR